MNAGMGGGCSVSGVSHGVCKGDLYVARVAETDKWSIVGEGSMENLSEQGVCSHKPCDDPCRILTGERLSTYIYPFIP